MGKILVFIYNEMADFEITFVTHLLEAICAGPRFLAKTGILDNVKYTTSIVEWTEAHEQQFRESDPFPRHNFVLDRVIRDGNIITAQSNAFVDFAIEVCDWFGAFDGEEDKNGFAKTIKGV